MSVDYKSMNISDDQWRRFSGDVVGLTSDTRFKERTFNQKSLDERVEFFNNKSQYELDNVSYIGARTTSADGGVFCYIRFDTANQERDEQVYLPILSKKEGSKWVALDQDFNVMSEHNTHSDLKEEYHVESVTGFEYNGERYYDLTYSVETRMEAKDCETSKK